MDLKQLKQENQYKFPYHHVCDYIDGNFSQTQSLYWGYEYMSYLGFVLSILEKESANTLVDIGCGDGKLIMEAKRNNPTLEVSGVDFSKSAVALAKYFNPDSKIVVGDIVQQKDLFTSYFDAATLVEVLEHIPPDQIDSFLSAVNRLLKTDGVFVVTVPSDNNPVNKKHYQHFNEQSLRTVLNKSFTIKEVYFLNTNSFLQRMLERLLSNRFYILNNKHLLNLLYSFYKNNFLESSANTCGRVCMVCTPKK